MKNLRLFFISLLLIAVTPVIAGTATYEAQPSPTPADENHRELFDYELNYTGNSSFFDDHGKFGNGDSLYNDFSYAHRFLITGKWYFRAGVEYERFDFNGTNNGLPDHLQTVHALLAFEYVVHDHAGAGIEIQPGPYFESNVTGDSIDIPWKVWVTFPLKKDKIFAVIGAGGSIYSNPIVAPGGGIIWLFSDHFRLEGVFPKPALVYNPSDNWEFRIFGNLFYESYRTDDVITPERKLQVHNAVVQYSEDKAGVQASYSGLKPFEITLGGGVTVRRDFDFFRAEASAKTTPAPFVKFEVTANFQAGGHISPCALEFPIRHRDPIVVASDECDARIIDLSLSHFVGPVVHVDPPFSAIGAAELPLVASVYSLCLIGLEAVAHR